MVALEQRGMREYAKINPKLRVLDALYGLLVESEIIPTEVTERCSIEFSINARNLQIILTARTDADQEFCSETSVAIADIIDHPEMLQTYVPDSFQFATAAVSGVIERPDDDSGANRLGIHSYSLFICTLFLSTLALLYF